MVLLTTLQTKFYGYFWYSLLAPTDWTRKNSNGVIGSFPKGVASLGVSRTTNLVYNTVVDIIRKASVKG